MTISKRIGSIHGIGNVAAVVLFALTIWMRSDVPGYAAQGGALALEVIAFAMLGVLTLCTVLVQSQRLALDAHTYRRLARVVPLRLQLRHEHTHQCRASASDKMDEILEAVARLNEEIGAEVYSVQTVDSEDAMAGDPAGSG